MERNVLKDLIAWKNNPRKKTLILRGARQTGKTYIINKFWELYYDNVAYFNFDHDDTLKNLFKITKDPNRIIDQLSLISETKITSRKNFNIFWWDSRMF